jgi:mono/diheme cytochrome c family protein/glucose/arabinose dehydrogenase
MPSNVACLSNPMPLMNRSSLKWIAAFAVALAIGLTPRPCLAQRGDKKGEVQIVRIPKEKIPPAPPLSPEAESKTFSVSSGFKIELFAAEPLIQVPVAAQFDAAGRLWVVEMRGFMPNADGLGEEEPVGRVSILEDTDGDGRADRSTVFLDGLVMPRALLLVRDGLLLGEPPHLWYYPIQNDKPGTRVAVATDFGSRANPEHTANSLVLGIDNWVYSLYHTWRYRFTDGRWKRESMPQRAQWGLSQDDFGRLFYTSNSDQLRGDLVPSHYFASVKQKPPGIGIQIIKDQTVWPARVNPGVNRAYQPSTLRTDGTLTKFTAACGTCIYRGGALPGCDGNAFICEPGANLIRRDILAEQSGAITARNACDKAEFLTSTDELFRPVNIYTGPDGALYVLDMYHGIIQHKVFLTSYLRAQSEDRGLDKVIDKGRIWRIVAEGRPARSTPPRLNAATPASLVETLSHSNGWWRDTAQRLLVERADNSIVPALRQLASGTEPLAFRLQALWTLEGLGRLDSNDIVQAMASPQARLRAVAMRMAEGILRSTNATTATPLRERVLKLATDSAAELQIQSALTLGLLTNDTRAMGLLRGLAKNATTPLARDCATYSINVLDPPKPTNSLAKLKPLSAEEKKRFDDGKGLYEQVCLACHQAHGLGQPGLAPPLVGSEWVAGTEKRLVRIVLNGMRGKVKVKGEEFELDMPALGVLDDDQIAALLTYVRREWDHTYAPVAPETVKAIRTETEKREDAWTAADLLKVQ